MSRKKLILISLLSILTLINSGCANNTSETKQVLQNKEDKSSKEDEIKPTDEILNADIFSNKIQLGNHVLELSSEYEDFITAGAIMTDKEVTENVIIAPNSSKECRFSVRDSDFTLFFKNISDKDTKLSKSHVEHIRSESGNNIFFPKGVRIGDTFDDVIAKWGEPTCKVSSPSAEELRYCYYKFPMTNEIKDKIIQYKTWNDTKNSIDEATHDKYTLTIDKATGTVKHIEYSWENDNKFLKTIPGNGITYKVPYNYTNFDLNELHSVENIDDINYLIILPSSTIIHTRNKPRDEASIRSDIPNEEFTDYDFEVIKENDKELFACEFYQNSSTSYLGRFVYVCGNEHYISRWCQITTLNNDEVLSDNAISVFKDKIKNLALSVE